MALIKVVRKTPEVLGGNTEAFVAEENLTQALSNGWVKAEEKPAKPEVKKEEVVSKPEEKVEEKSEKVEAPKKAKKSL